MHTKLTPPEALTTGALTAGAPLAALVLAALSTDFVPVAVAHPVLSLLCVLIGAGVLYAFRGERGLAGRALAGGASVALPLLALTVGALVLPLFSSISLSVPDLGSLAIPEVPGVVWLGLVLLVVGVAAGCVHTHDRAWGAVAAGPLALLLVVLLVFAAAGQVPGLPGATEPHLRAGAERAVSLVQGGAEDASASYYDGASRALSGLDK